MKIGASFLLIVYVLFGVVAFFQALIIPIETRSNYSTNAANIGPATYIHNATKVSPKASVKSTTVSQKSGRSRAGSDNATTEFARFSQCRAPKGAKLSDLPDIGPDFEVELEGTQTDSNLTYKTATFSDGTNRRGVVAMDFQGRKEIILYDLKSSTTFHVRDRTCTTEPLYRTGCNPLSYFMLRSTNNSLAVAPCKFESTKPVTVGSTNSTLHRWQHCLRLQSGSEKHNFLLRYSFRLNIFGNTPLTKWIPVRLEVERLGPELMSSSHSVKPKMVFDFLSFRPRLKNQSIFQAKEYANCSGWNNSRKP